MPAPDGKRFVEAECRTCGKTFTARWIYDADRYTIYCSHLCARVRGYQMYEMDRRRGLTGA